jgi:hypothetical protein
MPDQECLNCRHWKPIPPEEWKPRYLGQTFDLWGIRALVGDYPKWNAGASGKCYLQPEPVLARSVHSCGQWKVNSAFLRGWAEMGAIAEAHKEITRLRVELKAAQKLATERFRKLRATPKTNGRAAREDTQPQHRTLRPNNRAGNSTTRDNGVYRA